MICDINETRKFLKSNLSNNRHRKTYFSKKCVAHIETRQHIIHCVWDCLCLESIDKNQTSWPSYAARHPQELIRRWFHVEFIGILERRTILHALKLFRRRQRSIGALCIHIQVKKLWSSRALPRQNMSAETWTQTFIVVGICKQKSSIAKNSFMWKITEVSKIINRAVDSYRNLRNELKHRCWY